MDSLAKSLPQGSQPACLYGTQKTSCTLPKAITVRKMRVGQGEEKTKQKAGLQCDFKVQFHKIPFTQSSDCLYSTAYYHCRI